MGDIKLLKAQKSKKGRIITVLSVIILLSLTIPPVRLAYPSAKKKPNIILITIDALRPDHMSCYGYKRDTTPNISGLVKEGIIFTQAISQSSFTPASLISILTATYLDTHRVYDFGIPLKKEIKTLPEMLKHEGYYLGFISGRGSLAEFYLTELEDKFDSFYPLGEGYIQADEVSKNAIQWLRLNGGKSFFLWLYYLDPHTPYDSPRNELYATDKFSKEGNEYLPIAEETRQLFDGYKAIPRVTAVKGKTDKNYYIARYDGEISFVDEQIGMVLTQLKKQNLYDNTLIVITSDHGECMGERGYYFVHGDRLYDELLKVPLVMYFKGFKRHEIIRNLVRSIDIVPTILDVSGISNPWNMDGVSLLPLIQKGTSLVEYSFSALDKIQCIRNDRWKLISDTENNKYELYNLENDPGELINLANAEKAEFNLLHNELSKRPKKPQNEAGQQKAALDAGVQDKLKSLGYIR